MIMIIIIFIIYYPSIGHAVG